jgi:hypothetical protein
MTQENLSRLQFWYDQDEGYESRCRHRLLNDLGVDEVAAETILRLRSQVIELQAQIRLLEANLSVQVASQQMRLAPYREVHYEATWIELESQK